MSSESNHGQLVSLRDIISFSLTSCLDIWAVSKKTKEIEAKMSGQKEKETERKRKEKKKLGAISSLADKRK